jgi:hypothetical protein
VLVDERKLPLVTYEYFADREPVLGPRLVDRLETLHPNRGGIRSEIGVLEPRTRRTLVDPDLKRQSLAEIVLSWPQQDTARDWRRAVGSALVACGAPRRINCTRRSPGLVIS